jgi:ABC-type antimicrobial peptide transport system permease subunit
LEDENCLELIINSSTNTDVPDKTIKKINNYLTGISNNNIKIATWDKTIPLFYTIANIWKTSGYITQIIFIIFSLIILINLTSLVIYSRKKEFGTLLAIGFSWKKIILLICIEYLILGVFSVLFAFISATIINLSFPKTGIYIPSKDMQQALMTEYIIPFLYFSDLIYVMLLFCLTIIASAVISIFRIKKLSPIRLINNN